MAVPLIFKSDLHIKSLAILTALTPREGHYFLKMHEFLPFSVGDSSFLCGTSYKVSWFN